MSMSISTYNAVRLFIINMFRYKRLYKKKRKMCLGHCVLPEQLECALADFFWNLVEGMGQAPSKRYSLI